MKKLAIVAAAMVSATAWAGEVIVEAPAVDGVTAPDYRVFVSVETPGEPPGVPEETDGTFVAEDGKIYRVIVKASTGSEYLQRAIFYLQKAAGVRQ